MLTGSLRAFLLVACVGLPAMNPPVAMVMDCQGSARVRSGGIQDPLTLLSELPAGSEIKLAAGSHLTWVTLQTGEEIQISGPVTFKLGPKGRPLGQVAATFRPVPALQLSQSLRPGGLAQASLVMREANDRSANDRQGLRPERTPDLNPLSLLEPPSPTTLEARPEFRWKPLAGASWTFHLQDAAGHLLVHAVGPKPAVDLPPGTALKGGQTYAWDLTAELPNGTRLQTKGRLHRLAEADAAAINQARGQVRSSFARRMLYAALLEQAGLQAEARQEWRQLLRERPQEPTLQAKARGGD